MTIVSVTMKGLLRDRVLQGILVAALVFLVIPSISTLSMRQVTELSLTLCLSLASFILLLLAVFLGGVSLWRDVERRYTHSALTLPRSRTRYLLERFTGTSLFLLGISILLGLLTLTVVSLVAANYPPDRPVSWLAVLAALGFDTLKCLLLVAFALFFSSVSTSFFLPVFGTIAIYLVGGATQQAYDYVLSPAGQTLSPLSQKLAEILYYILPNLSAFDLKVNAIYALPLDIQALALTCGYGLLYMAFVLIAAAAVYSRRELG
jgi:ABC-type transport system involved in multi-copper enzyme maturation permease subunit